jgi:hypothetical protein
MCRMIYDNGLLYIHEFRSILVLISQPKNYDRHIRSSETCGIDRTKKKRTYRKCRKERR